MAQRTGLKKAELQALADAQSPPIEYTTSTTNADLEDALEAAGVDLESAEEAPMTTSSDRGDDRPAATEVELEGTPASPSGTRVVGEPVPAVTSHAQPEPALTIESAPEAPQAQAATAGGNIAGGVAAPTSVAPPASIEDVSTEELMRAREIIDKALSVREAPLFGEAGSGGAPIDRAKDLPIYHEHEVTLVDAAGMVDIEPEDVLPNSVHVRQRVDNKGAPYGEAWVTLVDVHGGKHAARL